MKLKTATLWGMIGSIITIFLNFFYFLLNANVIDWAPAISIATNFINLFASGTLALFFYTLYKNQK